jgi:predicted transposase/invertase (TIGR01784 family)
MGKKVLTAYERALEEGREEGELRGEHKKALETARKMRDEGDSLEKILRISGLSEDQLRGVGFCRIFLWTRGSRYTGEFFVY